MSLPVPRSCPAARVCWPTWVSINQNSEEWSESRGSDSGGSGDEQEEEDVDGDEADVDAADDAVRQTNREVGVSSCACCKHDVAISRASQATQSVTAQVVVRCQEMDQERVEKREEGREETK